MSLIAFHLICFCSLLELGSVRCTWKCMRKFFQLFDPQGGKKRQFGLGCFQDLDENSRIWHYPDWACFPLALRESTCAKSDVVHIPWSLRQLYRPGCWWRRAKTPPISTCSYPLLSICKEWRAGCSTKEAMVPLVSLPWHNYASLCSLHSSTSGAMIWLTDVLKNHLPCNTSTSLTTGLNLWNWLTNPSPLKARLPHLWCHKW